MNFLLTGFSSDPGFRVFEFEGVAAGKSRTDFSVRADLAVIKDLGIRVQELLLLCRRPLEDRDEAPQERLLTFIHELTFTCKHMRLHAELCAEETAVPHRRRPKYRRPFHPVQAAAVPVSRPGEHI